MMPETSHDTKNNLESTIVSRGLDMNSRFDTSTRDTVVPDTTDRDKGYSFRNNILITFFAKFFNRLSSLNLRNKYFDVIFSK